MEVYSYYYGASVEKGICVQAQSKEIDKLHLDSTLRDLASLHALESSEHSNEKLSFLLGVEGYCVLGVSYIESPNNSGYTRSAPCSLQYIVRGEKIAKRADEYGKIINFINFRKPTSTVPAAMDMFPLTDSGYYYHNNSKVLAALVDGLLQVALSEKDTLLVALPKGKNSEYATARYTMAEVINCIPSALRTNVRFFTGIPVMEGITNPLTGYDTAMKYGANVVFCPSEYFAQLKSHRNCIGIDMDNPSGQTGFFAEYVANAPNTAEALSKVINNATDISYTALNKAAQQVDGGNVVTIDMVREQLNKSQVDYQNLERDYARLGQEHNDFKARLIQAESQSSKYQMLEKEYKRIRQENNDLQMQLDRVQEQRNKIKDYQSIEKENARLKQQCQNYQEKLNKAQEKYGVMRQTPKGGKEYYKRTTIEPEHKHGILKFLGILLLVAAAIIGTFLITKPLIEQQVKRELGLDSENAIQIEEVSDNEDNTGLMGESSVNVPEEVATEEAGKSSVQEESGEQFGDREDNVEGTSADESTESEPVVGEIPLPETAEEWVNGVIDLDNEMPSVAPLQGESNGQDTKNVSEEFSKEAPVTNQDVLLTQYPEAQQEQSNNPQSDAQVDELNEDIDKTPPEASDNLIGRYGTIKGDGVHVRVVPSKDDDKTIIDTINKGKLVWMIEYVINDEDEKWIRVFYTSKAGNVEGYIRNDFIKETTDRKNKEYIRKNGTPDL